MHDQSIMHFCAFTHRWQDNRITEKRIWSGGICQDCGNSKIPSYIAIKKKKKKQNRSALPFSGYTLRTVKIIILNCRTLFLWTWYMSEVLISLWNLWYSEELLHQFICQALYNIPYVCGVRVAVCIHSNISLWLSIDWSGSLQRKCEQTTNGRTSLN